MARRRASEIAYTQATMFSPDANDQPPSSDRWREIEAEHLRQIGKPELAEEFIQRRASGRELEAKAAAEAERHAVEAMAEEERCKQARVEDAMEEMFPGWKKRRR